jgi:gluconokinase
MLGDITSDLPPDCSAIVVMGVSGCGKSSVAEACAQALGWSMLEGDSFHSAESKAKMRAGLPLDDADRAGWLDRLAALLASDAAARAGGVVTASALKPGIMLTCSSLRRRYRDQLRKARPGLGFVFLRLDYAAALQRVRERSGHLFPPTLVASQFQTLESPEQEAGVLTVDATVPLNEVIAIVLRHVMAT